MTSVVFGNETGREVLGVGMEDLGHVGDIVAIDASEDLGKFIVMAIGVDHLLNLGVGQLDSVKDGMVWIERAPDAV